MADEGKLQKMEVDYSATVDEKIPQCSETAKVSVQKKKVLSSHPSTNNNNTPKLHYHSFI